LKKADQLDVLAVELEVQLADQSEELVEFMWQQELIKLKWQHELPSVWSTG
jgi:hypothetical protein